MDESGKATTVDWVKIAAWLDVNKKRVITWAAATLVVVASATLFIYYENQKEVRASRALSEVTVPLNPAKAMPPGTVEALLKIERDYPNTQAAARALVQAGGILFTEARYDEAQKLFARFEKEYPESPWLPQAQLGFAATLAAQDKTAEALAEYEKLRKRYPNDPIADEVKLALIRLYDKQNRPEEALALCQDILRSNPMGASSVGAEAGFWAEDLIQRHPALLKTNVPPAPVVSTNLSPTPPPATNRVQTISITNLMKPTNVPAASVPATNRPATNVPLMLQSVAPTSAPSALPR